MLCCHNSRGRDRDLRWENDPTGNGYGQNPSLTMGTWAGVDKDGCRGDGDDRAIPGRFLPVAILSRTVHGDYLARQGPGIQLELG